MFLSQLRVHLRLTFEPKLQVISIHLIDIELVFHWTIIKIRARRDYLRRLENYCHSPFVLSIDNDFIAIRLIGKFRDYLISDTNVLLITQSVHKV